MYLDDTDEGHKLEHMGLTVKFFCILQVLLKFSFFKTTSLLHTSWKNSGEVMPEIPTWLQMLFRDNSGYYILVFSFIVFAIISVGYYNIILTKVIAEHWEHSNFDKK